MTAAVFLLAIQTSAPGDLESVNGEILGYLKFIATFIGVIVLALFALRFWVPKIAGIHAPGNGPIQVVSRLTLEPRKTLYIVRAGSDYMMLAASDAGVQFLTSIDAEGIEAILKQASTNPEAGSDFASMIRLGRRSKAPS